MSAHFSRRWLPALGWLLGWAAAAPAGDAVIMPDGFTITGRSFKETGPVAYGFDVIEDGPKLVIYSRHTKTGGKLEKDVSKPPLTAYRRKPPAPISGKPPSFGSMKATEFTDNWWRTVKITEPDGFHYQEVRQLITYLDPYTCWVLSTTHNWPLRFHTAEMDVKLVRKLLAAHPDLAEKGGPPDPLKRLAMAAFFKDAGWLAEARRELDDAKRVVPGAWPKEAAERETKLRADLELSDARLLNDELEAAAGAGRYESARAALAGFTPTVTDAKELGRLAAARAQIDAVRGPIDDARRLLADLLRRAVAGPAGDGRGAVGGAVVSAVPDRVPVAPEVAALLPAAQAVLDELHPDTVGRVELFTTLAKQAEVRVREGKDPGTTPAKLLALAVTGWLKGKNGADPDPAVAAKCWASRAAALAYLADNGTGDRRGRLNAYLQSANALPADELAQMLPLLPPPLAGAPGQPPGPEVPPAEALVRGVYRLTAPAAGVRGDGVEYYLRLPPEYHPGRSYPLLLALNQSSQPAEKFVGSLAEFADKFGYIVAASVWVNQFAGGYDWSGKDHPVAAAVLRDALRRFQADPDRVFAFGFGDGASFAMDLGASHPDLFAGVVALGPDPWADLFVVAGYWHNAQKLPHYVVTGEMSGSGAPDLRKVFERWMPKGFPALLTNYKGRGVEWYGMEIPRAFDWMNRKVRVRGTAALRLDAPALEAWHITRETDNRFYWVGTTDVKSNYLIRNYKPLKGALTPAYLGADLRPGNVVLLSALGVRNAVVWLQRDMIDWSRPVSVVVNGTAALRYVPKVMTPDIGLMFEEAARTGDRKTLILGRIEVPVP